MNTPPKGWKVRGEMPDVEFEHAGLERRDLFDEDIVTITAPRGEYSIDVGWYPAQSEEGEFQGRLIAGGAWDEPLEVFSSRSGRRTSEWIDAAIERVAELIGERVDAEFSDEGFITFPVITLRVEPALTQDEDRAFETAPAEQRFAHAA